MKYILILTFSVLMFSCTTTNNNEGYVVKGKIEGIDTGKIVFNRYDMGHKTMEVVQVDTAEIVLGEFELSGKLDSPQKLFATISPGGYTFSIWLENKSIRLEGTVEDISEDPLASREITIKSKGAPIQAEFDAFEESKKHINDQMAPLKEALYKAKMDIFKGMKSDLPEKEMEELEELRDQAKDKLSPFYAQIREIDFQHMDKHPQSIVTAQLIRNYGIGFTPEELQEKYDLLSIDVKNTYLGREIRDEIERVKISTAKKVASLFSRKDMTNKLINLSDYKGQYVLLDFWASFCKPCRAGNPHLIKLYKKYHKKGIEFIGISEDSNIKAWHKAVKKDQINIWPNILSEDKESGMNISDSYGVQVLPTKILINPEGFIIARFGGTNDKSENLDKMLEEIFGE